MGAAALTSLLATRVFAVDAVVQGVNVKGSIKLSLRIGKYLEENYDLIDHRGDPKYDSWQRCLEEWQAAYPEMANMIRNETEEK